MDTTTVIIRPIITEKSMREAGNGKFTFAVATDASKTKIKKAVENGFKVTVVSVQTVTTKGKTKRVGKIRREIQVSPSKKAVVSLKKGQKIDLFDIQEGKK